MLYVVATPIGNLGDMSPRAVEVLKSVALIAAEDTRMTMKLTQRFGIETPLTSCHRHNEQGKAESIVRRMLEEGIDVAVVTDAGTPAISDPGTILVRQAAEAGHRSGGRARPQRDGRSHVRVGHRCDGVYLPGLFAARKEGSAGRPALRCAAHAGGHCA